MPVPAETTAHPLRCLLAIPAFRRLWAVGGIANAMRWVEVLVAAIWTFEATGSAFAVSLVALMRALPMLLLGAAAGALAELLDRKKLLVVGQAANGLGALGILLLALGGALEVWHLAAQGFLGGLVWTGEMASRRRMLTEVAGERDVVTAVAFDSLTANTTRMAGPLLGGAIYQFLGLPAGFALAALGYGLTCTLLAGVVHTQARRRFGPRLLLAEMADALRVVRRMKPLQAVILITIAMNIFGFCFVAVLPAFGAAAFAASPVQIGMLTAAEPAGALLTGLVLASRRGVPLSPALMLGGGAGFLLCLLLLAMVPSLPLALGVLMLGGIGTALFAALQTALPVTQAPPEARSRVLGLVTTCIGMGPTGQLAIGALADSLGPAAAIPIMAGLGLLMVAGTAWQTLRP
ncbi:MFS transporter [Roseicella aerolata]|uniref:MFS transporter n=1 Tax=Roseicella aerolata TaxID=2883479 RepID=A0A9X1II42_9PROT|nr:MFS transporter [Roseicella aerolata]MCB4825261.1 MFS transporter [Roseicella aerolata]